MYYNCSGALCTDYSFWNARVTIKRLNLYDLNYRVGFTINKAATTSAHTEHELNTPELRSNVSESFGLTPR